MDGYFVWGRFLYINEKPDNKVEWKEYNEGVRVDNACFVKGDEDSFRQWISDNHPEMLYDMEDKRFNR